MVAIRKTNAKLQTNVIATVRMIALPVFIFVLLQITTGITEHERLTQRKSKRPIEGLVFVYAQHGRDLIG